MYIGQVIGTVVCTVKDPSLTGIKLLIVQPLDDSRNPKGDPIVAADGIATSGVGEFVYLAGKKEAAYPFPGHFAPVDAAIVGFIDHYYIDSASLISQKPKPKASTSKKVKSPSKKTQKKKNTLKTTPKQTKVPE